MLGRTHYLGITSALPRHYLGVTLALPRRYLCITLALPWRYFGVTLALTWRYLGVTWASPWRYLGVGLVHGRQRRDDIDAMSTRHEDRSLVVSEQHQVHVRSFLANHRSHQEAKWERVYLLVLVVAAYIMSI